MAKTNVRNYDTLRLAALLLNKNSLLLCFRFLGGCLSRSDIAAEDARDPKSSVFARILKGIDTTTCYKHALSTGTWKVTPARTDFAQMLGARCAFLQTLAKTRTSIEKDPSS